MIELSIGCIVINSLFTKQDVLISFFLIVNLCFEKKKSFFSKKIIIRVDGESDNYDYFDNL